MKNIFPIFSTCLLLVSVAIPGVAQQTVLSKEEMAIKNVIESESKHFWGRDYEGWASLYVHAPYTSWTSATKDGVRHFTGWESWSNQVKELFQSDPKPQEYEGVVFKYNYKFRIYKNGAWVSFEQMNGGTKTLENRIMEKENGQWKIAMVEVVYNANEQMTGGAPSTGN